MKFTIAGEQSEVMSEVKDGVGVASTVMSVAMLPEHPEIVLSEDN